MNCVEFNCTYLLRRAGGAGLEAAGFLVSVDAAAGLVLDAALAVGAVAEDAAGRREERLVLVVGVLAAGAFAAGAGAFVAGALAASLGAAGLDTFAGLGLGAGVADLVFGGVLGAAFGRGLFADAGSALEALAVEIVEGFLTSSFLAAGVPLVFALLSAGLEVSAAGASSDAGAASSVIVGTSVEDAVSVLSEVSAG